MPNYLRNTTTQEWLDANGQFTKDFELAVPIHSVGEGMQKCRELSLRDMELVIYSDRNEIIAVLPIRADLV